MRGLELHGSLPLVSMVLQPWLGCLQQQWDGSWVSVSLSKALVGKLLPLDLRGAPLERCSQRAPCSSGIDQELLQRLEITPGWRNLTEQGWSGTSGLISALKK